ncbi:transcriptional regulator [Dinoroseobacter shibae DFL 12 = DSM 16493]|jgi:DNA-binding CsgD family transcriptional regulator|uniref:Transcriptional regulator n=1 Tax=Dinoroseobacter shibae (strain DSM 16493 / NCIMB 14021 / DFL 12) TaxID=398580 RepID=A8LSG2_DINSH|nr:MULTISPECIES: LuxR C-terminal-related transcriptional regulator [Dinoroseobacter]ABV92776.1 transcriptional regulator [Dinoroseobacter shibae DFL 12 = DSM 16493]MDD9715876.1 LuxR C-terminal-related transcriptional regulator [Dinoroseobacter sp. PD6]URF47719.1 LuxR C-terminal-related transcriptional regulator [Dinoroseobacter shibae]URF52029.1 LuxR C-terminal-related transcriptional regulator [Dinoroseobacter shibae]
MTEITAVRARRSVSLTVVLCVQVVCAFFFVADITLSVLGIPFAPLSWQVMELIEIGAALGLIIGVAVGILALREARARTAVAERALQAASGAFMDLVEERFTEWGLTPAERDVALFALKGLTLQEIAAMRATSEGTVKAQTNAIYRKSGVANRAQLVSLFVEDLMGEAISRPGVDAAPAR